MTEDKEIILVRAARPADPPNDPAVKARAWARLHAEFAGPAPRRLTSRPSRGRPLITAGVVAAGAAVALIISVAGGTTPARTKTSQPGPQALPSLELAAATVERETPTAPRPNQWIYTRTLFATSAGMAAPSGRLRGRATRELWEQYGATRTATIDPRTGQVKVAYDAEAARATEDMKLPQFAKYLNSLPTDPDALLRQLRKDSKDKLFVSTVGNGDTNEPVFESVEMLFMRAPFIPPKVNGALFRTLNRLPGVHVERVTDAAGRRTVGAYRDSPGLDRREILFHPRTFRYMGSRFIAVHDFTTDGSPKLFGRAGQVLSQSALLTRKVTDGPGRR
jgi:hypothetical protein